MLQGVPVLWSTRRCPSGPPRKGFLSPRRIGPRALGHSGKPLRWLQAEGDQGLGIYHLGGVTSLPVGGGGGRSCSHAQGIADRQRRWGQEGIFPRGQIGTGPRGFFAFLCSTEQDRLLSGLLRSILAWSLPAAHAP